MNDIFSKDILKIVTRIDKLQTWMRKESIESLLIDDPTDLFYLTGLTLSLGVLFLSRDSVALFVDGRYLSVATQKGDVPVFPLSSLKEHGNGLKAIGFDSAFVSFDRYLELQTFFPSVSLIPVSKPLNALRGVKDSIEIEKLKNAQRLTKEGFLHVQDLLEVGVTEEEIAVEFETFCRKKGASKLSFPPIIAFGKNSAYPHHKSGKEKLKKDQVVLFDLGCVLDGYAGDMTRVIFFGEPDERIKKDYDLVRRAQKKAIEAAAPGVLFGELDIIARKEIEKEGLGDLFTHGLSHGIGLDVHEYPRLRIGQRGDHDLVLEPGMTFTVEPGIYRDGVGGVRYEDIVVITKDGHETF